MLEKPFSRRSFVTVAGVAPAAAQSRQPVVVAPFAPQEIKAQGDPLRIVTMYQFEPAEVKKIQATVPDARVEIAICKSREEFREKLRDAEVVYGDLRAADLDYAPRLKWMQAGGAGMEGMDPKVAASPIVITNYARTFAHGISETAIGLLLCLTRGLSKYYMPQFSKRTMNPIGTVKSDDHTELVGRTMGIVGMGGIGSMLARRAYYGFDMRIIATDAKPIPKPEYVAELHDPTYFMKMVPQVDVLVAVAPHTKQTERMFNEQVFRSMK